MFVRHSPGAATLEIAPTAAPAGDDDAKVEPRRRHELLQHRSVPLEPEPVLERAEVAAERDLVLTELDVAAPAPEPRLDDERALPLRHLAARKEDAGARVRQARALQHLCRQELVVRGEERTGPVQHDDSTSGERAKRPQAVLDAIQPDHDV